MTSHGISGHKPKEGDHGHKDQNRHPKYDEILSPSDCSISKNQNIDAKEKSQNPDVFIPWKRLGFGQIFLFCLSLATLIDLNYKLSDRGDLRDCDGHNNVRTKRGLKEVVVNMTSGSKKDKNLWVHSLSKIQVKHLLY